MRLFSAVLCANVENNPNVHQKESICTMEFFFLFLSFLIYFEFFSFIFISWRLITLQYRSGFCHTLTWISHGFTCVPHPDPPSHLPLHPIPLGLPSAPCPSTCLMHPAWAGDLFHPRWYTCFNAVLSKHVQWNIIEQRSESRQVHLYAAQGQLKINVCLEIQTHVRATKKSKMIVVKYSLGLIPGVGVLGEAHGGPGNVCS